MTPHASVVDRERETYETVWKTLDTYGEHAPGAGYVPIFLEMAGCERPSRRSVLDAGCGSGKGALALDAAGFDRVVLCDVTDAGLIPEVHGLRFVKACLWDDLRPRLGYAFYQKFDYVYCCDVLEHIPPQFTMLVVSRLLEVARRGVFLSISLVPDVFGNWVGRPLHQTVQPFVWWRDNLSALGTVRECRDLLHAGLYFVEPRC